jgi:hypothetical protein
MKPRALGVIVTVMSMAAACTVEIPTTDDPVLRSCYRWCDVMSNAPECRDPAASELLCTAVCDTEYVDVPVDCRDEAQGYWSCMATVDWRCPADDSAGPEADDAARCEATSDAWSACDPSR